MNLILDNVNLSSNSGPNSFAAKLNKYLPSLGITLEPKQNPDAYLCFIETMRQSFDKPMYQRLDGIYFNTASDYNLQNRNIKRTYDMADGVIFQSEFNEKLITKYFGKHENSTVIHNGADLTTINLTPALKFNRYENLWACASSWRPHKRLNENIRYFLEHSNNNDGLMIAGAVSKNEQFRHERIHYVGTLSQRQLYALYKRSKFFIHLAWLDHCPNVVVDARACGCQIICSSAGGTMEIAGENAIVIGEEKWNLEPLQLYNPPDLDFNKVVKNSYNSCYDMEIVANKYIEFIRK